MTTIYSVTHKDNDDNLYICDVCGRDLIYEELVDHAKVYHPRELKEFLGKKGFRDDR